MFHKTFGNKIHSKVILLLRTKYYANIASLKNISTQNSFLFREFDSIFLSKFFQLTTKLDGSLQIFGAIWLCQVILKKWHLVDKRGLTERLQPKIEEWFSEED